MVLEVAPEWNAGRLAELGMQLRFRQPQELGEFSHLKETPGMPGEDFIHAPHKGISCGGLGLGIHRLAVLLELEKKLQQHRLQDFPAGFFAGFMPGAQQPLQHAPALVAECHHRVLQRPENVRRCDLEGAKEPPQRLGGKAAVVVELIGKNQHRLPRREPEGQMIDVHAAFGQEVECEHMPVMGPVLDRLLLKGGFRVPQEKKNVSRERKVRRPATPFEVIRGLSEKLQVVFKRIHRREIKVIRFFMIWQFFRLYF